MSGNSVSHNIDYLLKSGCPWAEYRCLADLCGAGSMDGHSAAPTAIADARKRMLEHPLVKALISELAGWPGKVLNSHKSAGQLYHKLSFAADLGIDMHDPGMEVVIEKVMEHQSEEGPFQLSTNVPVHFGGSGRDEWAWALCDAPILLAALARLGLADNPRVLKGASHLLGLVRDNGWPCAVSKGLGDFRGPGRKSDPCPYATLIMLKLIASYDGLKDSREAKMGAQCLLSLWGASREQHPYMFYMGSDFRKLKAPFIWYDIMHVADVLSQFDFVHKDPRFRDMIALIDSKADETGAFKPESEWKAWKDWDFGQKKTPSPWLTYLVYKIDKRIGQQVC